MLTRIARGVLASNVTALLKKPPPHGLGSTSPSAAIHTSEHRRVNKNRTSESTALVLHSFENVENKGKETFLDILRQYKNNNIIRRGHVEFIKVALKYMDEFEVNRDLAVYKAILDVLPKSKFIPTNYFQTVFMHYPMQQRVAVELLCKMEDNCVIPDAEMQLMLLNIFGVQGLPLKKFWRMMYWMPKFANLHPWPCPKPIPKDPEVLAKLAIDKLSSEDVTTVITVYKTKDVEDATEDTWIVSSISGAQQQLLQSQPTDKPIYVEGPYSVWVANQCIDYFVLRGDARKREEVYQDLDDVSDIRIPFWDKREVIPNPTVHEQDDGTYFAMCATGTSSKDSLLSWIRCLQKQNPILDIIPVVFKISSSTRNQLYLENSMREQEIMRSYEYP
ncbi:PREDICTED: evolutionarily conserved signaling intermediate in Toll pathway, mitochondrial [Dinoponera quadriceps]|uniref:Evolutionarily conserved signaling intermediate in Toll pathway, mitochondrial n=1 Tax=Dinoponera quadriceps TaxID=609295 RepID=A0A6P3XKS8_DINQU|nr:PREDICTED: evolutionarily conserved signaling intermediate in Toll pathway, mitochondrial [Dinoponera quadriceps]XP_014478863.1 PREDICTED: evolutionarily conserved signaling intermediate in Toll pathway, mitochondrial [Dinoponera quadriceps]XP_014478864.1 PREDICTED: evolutionarily conserved signaling intermediate in Toll pathway, mitochondrial [Dinoponera quadriceps]